LAELFVDAEFWVAVAFVIFFAAVGRLAFTRITAALDGRGARIKNELEEATRLREEAQALLASYQRKQRDAVRQAEEIIEQAREEAKRASEQAAQDFEAEIVRRSQQSLDRIAQAEARALQDVRNAAATLAIAATRRLIAESLDEERANALIEDALAEVADKLH
jgi:F-type H+-transporting ATPase subunit b